MTKSNDFINLVRDEAFIKLAKEASDFDDLLNTLQIDKPEEKESVRFAYEFIRLNLSDKKNMNQDDYQRILNHLEKYANRKKSSPFIRFVPILRIAAIIFVIFAIGSLIAYYGLRKDQITEFAQNEITNGDEAFIVLSDGTKQTVKNNNSIIDYKTDAGEVIVRKEAFEERIENENNIKKVVLNQIFVPYGQQQKVLLSDGTTVQLNAGSRLTFPATFYGNTREVYLKGEGFFDVKENKKMPFIVKTDNINIKVLGTKFNVCAYDDDRIVSAVLVEGKVNVTQKNKIIANDNFTLLPGQGCFYSIVEKSSQIKQVDINDYILWKDGLYNFRNAPLSEVVNRVSKYYNVTIEIKGEKLPNSLISGKLLLSDSISDVIKYISKTMEVSFENRDDNTYTLKQ